ncbi:MAG: ketol-acid reductoisomerase [Proteobacteria bacterium]|nr:ketol-acid reductoisomerase [Pseudomonadota bacterium]
MKLYTEDDVNRESLKGQTIAIVGYGSQGRAHAHNLRDSGHRVIVGAREEGKSSVVAAKEGFDVFSPAEAAEKADFIAILTPDMAQQDLFNDHIREGLKDGNTIMFAHGFSILYDRVTPPENVDVVLIAPKGPGALVRREYERGRGVPCLVAVEQDASGGAMDRAVAYADALGATQGGIIETTFREETETDLFGEQAVLCGGLSELIVQGFETLVEAGYQPEIAYFECMHEVKLIVDLLHEGGLKKMYEFVSETAKYGDFVSGPRVINGETRERMREVLKDIQSGAFAREWVLENQAGLPVYKAIERKDLEQDIEKVGAKLRARMPWLNREQSNFA